MPYNTMNIIFIILIYYYHLHIFYCKIHSDLNLSLFFPRGDLTLPPDIS